MKTTSILVVDDDQSFRAYIAAVLRSRGYEVDVAENGAQLMQRVADPASIPSIILLDVLMPDSNGIELMRKLKDIGLSTPVIMLSGVNEVRTVVEAMKFGATDFVMKSGDEETLHATIEQLVADASRQQPAITTKSEVTSHTEGIVTLNPKMRRLAEIVARVARTDVPILIAGESGVGKEVMAKHAHRNSLRRERPFIKVNCAALPHDLLESELFGYVRGAFTGAINDKAGKFQLADGGTLLLDEIGDMSPLLQAKLLHVLQDGTLSPLGGRKSEQVDVRIIAATNINIEQAVADGKFREDLYFRLNVIRIDLPPLRERREDIPELCNYFMQKYSARYGPKGGKKLPDFLLGRFLRDEWPGNIRQLENSIKRFLVLPDDVETYAEDGFETLQPATNVYRVPSASQPQSLLDISAQAAECAEQDLVRRVLQETNGNRKQAAQRMNICYKALLNKLKRWNAASSEHVRDVAS